MDADIDGEGRILVGYADGCVDACVSGGPNSFSRRGYIARQATGRRMYEEFDPQDPTDLPGSPSLSATRDLLSVNLEEDLESRVLPFDQAAPRRLAASPQRLTITLRDDSESL